MSAGKNGVPAFAPVPGKLYRVFFREVENGVEQLKQVVGTVTLYGDGGVLVERENKPSTYIRTFEKMVEFVPNEEGR